MRQLVRYLVVACMAVLAWGADTTATRKKSSTVRKKSTVTAHRSTASAARKSTVPTARKSTTQTSATASRGTVAKKGITSKNSPKRTTTWRNRQLAPSPERYQEIQNALVAKGYLQPEEADGKWNQTSADALKKFQADQNLEVNGKINSLSLIALGLGPKHDTPAKPAENPQ